MIDKNKINMGIIVGKRQGYRVKPYCAAMKDKCGCALSVAAVGLGIFSETQMVGAEPELNGFTRPYRAAAEALGLNTFETNDLVTGFDHGLGHNPFPSEARQFGVELRKWIDWE